MTTIKAFIKSHPLLSYFALTFAISWGAVLIVVGPGGLPGTPEETEGLMPFAILAMLLGPTVVGILLTGLLYGRVGLRELLSRLLRWRVGARWYAIALLTAPLLFTAVLLPLSLTSSIFLPGILASDEKASVLLFGLVAGLMAGIFEELGWTGFATPRMRLRYGVLGTGLFVGFLWGAWHYFVTFWASGTASGAFSLGLFLPGFLWAVAVLTTFRVLMVWVYDRTGSLLVAMLMHASFTTSAIILGPLVIAGVPFLTWYLVLTAAMWVIVAAVAVANHGHLTPQPLLRRRVA